MVSSQQAGLVVSGYMAAAVSEQREGPKLRTIFVPGVTVFVEDLGSGTTSAPQRTDLSGRFTFHDVKPGKHRLCWKMDSFTSGCRGFDVTSDNVHLSETVMYAERRDQTTLVFGEVKLFDGSKPRLLEPLAGINAYARVKLLDAVNQPVAEAIVNNFGQYVLPQVPVRTPVTLQASVEAGIGEQPIMPEAQFELARAHDIDIVIANRAPKLLSRSLRPTAPPNGLRPASQGPPSSSSPTPAIRTAIRLPITGWSRPAPARSRVAVRRRAGLCPLRRAATR